MLVDELTKHRRTLAELRVSKVSSQPTVKLSKIRVSAAARILSVAASEEEHRPRADHPLREAHLRRPRRLQGQEVHSS